MSEALSAYLVHSEDALDNLTEVVLHNGRHVRIDEDDSVSIDLFSPRSADTANAYAFLIVIHPPPHANADSKTTVIPVDEVALARYRRPSPVRHSYERRET